MDQTFLNRAVFLIERADVPRALLPKDLLGNLLSSNIDAFMEQRVLSAFLTGLLLGRFDYTLKFNCE